jgi:large subunit ribosomal protein L9
MAMNVILTQDVDNLGKAGELVSVRPGYGRNYLVPRGLAVSATVRNKNRLDHEKAVIARRVEKERATATEIAVRINGMTLQFERMVGEDEKLFGSVTSRDIADQLKKANVEIDHRWVQLEAAVKALGKYEVPVRLAAGVVATLKFWVVGKDK